MHDQDNLLRLAALVVLLEKHDMRDGGTWSSSEEREPGVWTMPHSTGSAAESSPHLDVRESLFYEAMLREKPLKFFQQRVDPFITHGWQSTVIHATLPE